MDQDPRQYLLQLGTGSVVHNSGTDFYKHLIGVQDVLTDLNADPEQVLAGLFHSIYGTEGFQAFTVPLQKRPEIAGLIGPRAELVCYVNCVMDRASLDATLDHKAGSHFVVARPEVGGQRISLSDEQLTDLMAVHLADWLQQVELEAKLTNERHGWTKPGDAWGYRRGAYRKMAEVLGGSYLQLYQKIFDREPLETRSIHQKFTPKNAAFTVQDAAVLAQ